MSFELSSLMEARQGENFRLHSEYLNPQLVKVLKTLGFDRFYVRGEGATSTTATGTATSTSSPASASSPSAAATPW